METVARVLDHARVPTVIDPVMVAKGGAPLLASEAVAHLKRLLAPRAALITPNAPEAEALTGLVVADLDGQRRAGEALLQAGAGAVLIKGGHIAGDRVIDLLVDGRGELLLEGPRVDSRHTHGTGCTLASACATGLAQGLGLQDAVARAWSYVAEAIHQAPGLGQGHGPLGHGWPLRKS
jgi:hydroxymethylpyrimidine/phosphomethylpyrimidine kinase